VIDYINELDKLLSGRLTVDEYRLYRNYLKNIKLGERIDVQKNVLKKSKYVTVFPANSYTR